MPDDTGSVLLSAFQKSVIPRQTQGGTRLYLILSLLRLIDTSCWLGKLKVRLLNLTSMSQIPFDQLEQYQNQWVALAEPNQEIVGSGKDAVEASQDAAKHGYKDISLFRVPPSNSYFIGLGHGA
jgi:hypothetical protein